MHMNERSSRRNLRRKDPFSAVLGLAFAGLCWFALFKLCLHLQHSLLEEHDAFFFGRTKVSGILTFVPLTFPSLGIGFILANCTA